MAEKTKLASEALGATLYGVIYADPPWRFEPYSRETGLDRAADNHYPTLTVSGICKIKPPAADDCALFLWATAPMLVEALQVVSAWGFTYKSHFIWAKDRIGTGYWARSRHELLLIATKGNVPAPAPGEQFESVIQANVGRHSEKPIAFAEMIEEMFPTTRPLEMFARVARVGWDVWGNEVATAA
jgi:N6-adenosine-specific RNA methylase IME4